MEVELKAIGNCSSSVRDKYDDPLIITDCVKKSERTADNDFSMWLKRMVYERTVSISAVDINRWSLIRIAPIKIW